MSTVHTLFLPLALVLHTLAAVVWVGGMFFAHNCLRPAVGALEPNTRLPLWGRVFPRFFGWVWASVILLLATGLGMIGPLYGRFGAAPAYIHLMTLLGVVMMVLFALLYTVPYRGLVRALAAGDLPQAARCQDRIRRIITINLPLGLITVAVAAAGRVWSGF